MTADLTTLTTPSGPPGAPLSLTIPDGWQQGRGAFGGLVLAGMVRSLERALAAPERTLRSLTAEICAPVMVGAVEARVEKLREGSGASTLAVRLVQKGEVVAHAVGVFGKKRVADHDHLGAACPIASRWQDCDPVLVGPPFGPVFAPHFEFRPTGAPPLARGDAGAAAGWIRPRHPGPARDAAYLVALCDAWWPASFARMATLRPMATIAFTAEIVGDTAGLDPDAPLHHAAHEVVARDGYSVELRQLWGEDGRLLALNQQTVAVLK
jgi:acyl-CoA thioesterase